MRGNPTNDVVKLTLPEVDSPSGVSLPTWKRVSASCGLTDDEAIHMAMVHFAALVVREGWPKVRSLNFQGMNLAPLGCLMARHDSEWPQ